MKKLLFISLVVLLSACTRQQKAERLVKAYLDSALNDPHSYEPLTTKVDTFWDSKYQERLKASILKGGELNTDISSADTGKNFQYGWIITHTYRAKNGFGALGIHKIEAHSDKDFTKVIEIMISE